MITTKVLGRSRRASGAETYLRETRKDVARITPERAQYFHDYKLYDTTQEENVRIMSAGGGNIFVENDELYDEFLKRGE